MLTTRGITALKKPGRYSVENRSRLYLLVAPSGGKSWVYRFRRNGRSHDVGLGRFPTLILAEAREDAHALSRLLASGGDPLVYQREKRLGPAPKPTFREVAEAYITTKASGWSNPKTASIWRGSFEGHVYKTLGAMPVDTIDTPHIEKVLKPIWNVMPSTAGRVRYRISVVLDAAKAKKFRQGDNPAFWKTISNLGYSPPGKIRKVKHRPALPYKELPKFMAELARRKGSAARALEWTILTAARTSETITAEWADIKPKEKRWAVPADKMKSDKDHNVPLSPAALAILKALPREEGNPYLFVGGRKGHGLSNVMMLRILQAMRPGLTVHGFRSSFRTWAAEKQLGVPREVPEAALAHAVGEPVEVAYQRSRFWKPRVTLMNDWAAFIASPPPKNDRNPP